VEIRKILPIIIKTTTIINDKITNNTKGRGGWERTLKNSKN